MNKAPKDVTGFNHTKIGNGKPVISNSFFKEALDLIDAGDKALIETIESNYALDKTQQNLLNDRK